MSYELTGFLMTTIGELLVGYSVLRVHSSIEKEKHLDQKVLNAVKKEKAWTIAGMILISIGFIVQLASERFLL